MTYSEPLVPYLQAWEGLKLVPSPDRVNPKIIDIGHGHVLLPGEDLGPDNSITPEEAVQLLRWDLSWRSDAMERMVLVEVTQGMWDAMLSFALNVGLDDDDDTKPEGLGDSRLLRLVNLGSFAEAAEEFDLWIYSGGKVIPGLINRRAADRAMFERNDYSGRP